VTIETGFSLLITVLTKRASPGVAVKLCLGDLLVMGLKSENRGYEVFLITVLTTGNMKKI